MSENGPSEEAIARRAHEIWEREGRPEGRSLDHWEQARVELAEAEAMASQGLAGTAQAILADEEVGAADLAAGDQASDDPVGAEAPPAAKPKRRPRAKAPVEAAAAPHEAVDGTPDSFLDDLAPTPKGRSRKPKTAQ